MRSMEKTGHLAWCALVALHTAREDGLVLSESQENLFISRWFALAKKQRRFSRDVATAKRQRPQALRAMPGAQRKRPLRGGAFAINSLSFYHVRTALTD